MEQTKKFKIGIIGGTGGMGSLFKRIFEEYGHTVSIASRRTELSPIDCASNNEIVIVTVPIAATQATIEQVAPHVREDSVLLDFTSIKSKPIEWMLANSKCEVVGCHPVFGPSVASLKGQVIVLSPGRGTKWLEILNQLFQEMGAKMKIASAEEHDNVMAVVQGLMHFTSITLADTLRKWQTDIAEVNHYSSPVYRIRMDFTNRILNQDPALYADIELNNPVIVDLLKVYQESVEELLSKVEKKDRDGFVNTFQRCSTYLGDNKDSAEKRTNAIVDYLAKVENE